MTDRIGLKRGDLSGPAQWRLWRGLSVIVSCPLCGQRISVERRVYHIAVNGEVKPAIECPGDDCGFFDYVQLQDWDDD